MFSAFSLSPNVCFAMLLGCTNIFKIAHNRLRMHLRSKTFTWYMKRIGFKIIIRKKNIAF